MEHVLHAASYIVPEIILIATVCIHFLAGPFLVSDRGEAPAGLRHRWGALALLGLLTAMLAWAAYTPEAAVEVWMGAFRVDTLTWYIRGLMLAGGVVLLLTSWNQIDDSRAAEHHACLLAIVAGVNLIAAANDLIVLFLALELVSIPTYLYLYLPRRDAPAQEAVIKYFLLSVFSSALLLYGFSFLFGVTGTTNLTAMHAAFAAGGGTAMPAVLMIALVAVIAGLAFRITAVPFHFYAPDVFQGAPTTGAALLAFVPKVAGFVALVRLLTTPALEATTAPLWTLATQAMPVLWTLAVITMLAGNVLALIQTDIRRLLAYSSVAHAGYMLVGLTVGDRAGAAVGGIEALLFYLAVYGAMTVGVFAVLVALSRGDRRVESVDDLAGLSQRHPVAALAMAVFLFSLTGLPPTAGFLGKLNLFLAAWSAGTEAGVWLAIVLAVSAAIGAWYYLRIIGVMYLRPSIHEEPAAGRAIEGPAYVGVVLCALATVGLFAAPGWLWQIVEKVTA